DCRVSGARRMADQMGISYSVQRFLEHYGLINETTGGIDSGYVALRNPAGRGSAPSALPSAGNLSLSDFRARYQDGILADTRTGWRNKYQLAGKDIGSMRLEEFFNQGRFIAPLEV